MPATATVPAAPPWVRPVGRRDRRVDAVIAAVCLAGTAVTIPLFSTAPTTGASQPAAWVSVVWALLITVPLALRRVLPGTVAAIVTGAFIAGQALAVPEQLVSQIALVLALYTVGAWSGDRRRSLVVRVALVAALLVWMTVGLVALASDPSSLPRGVPFASVVAISLLTNGLAFLATFVFGETAWQSARRLAALEQRTTELAEERERSALQAVALERVRIARELHDVVAHHVSVMGVQAGAARVSLDAAPDVAARALEEVETNAREAVDELQRMLHTLRDDAEAGAPTDAASTQGVDRIGVLVAEAERAGTPTRLTVTGDARRLTPAAGHTVYRVVQEALTNVRKHAGAGAHAEVRLTYGPRDVVLEIADSGGGPVATVAGVSGLGQRGMRERVEAVGGALEASETDGGYSVRAVIPAVRS